MPLAPKAGLALHVKTGLRQTTTDSARGGIGRSRPTSPRVSRNLDQQLGLPKLRITRRCKPVQKPRIRHAAPARHLTPRVARDNLQPHTRRLKHQRPLRARRDHRACQVRHVRKNRQRPRHVIGAHREQLKRREPQQAINARRPPRSPGRQKTQARAKPQLGHLKPVAEPGEQSISRQKNVTRLCQSILKREIRIIKPRRDRHISAPFYNWMLVQCPVPP